MVNYSHHLKCIFDFIYRSTNIHYTLNYNNWLLDFKVQPEFPIKSSFNTIYVYDVSITYIGSLKYILYLYLWTFLLFIMLISKPCTIFDITGKHMMHNMVFVKFYLISIDNRCKFKLVNLFCSELFLYVLT